MKTNNEEPAPQPRRVIHELCAGGVVFRNTAKGARVGFIRNAYRRWTFPKGHVIAGETLEQAAVRESREEMGLNRLDLLEELGSIRIRFTERYRPDLRGALIDKRIHFFLLEAPPDTLYCPQRDEHIQNVTWVGVMQVRAIVGYKNLQPIAARAVDRIVDIRRRGRSS